MDVMTASLMPVSLFGKLTLYSAPVTHCEVEIIDAKSMLFMRGPWTIHSHLGHPTALTYSLLTVTNPFLAV